MCNGLDAKWKEAAMTTCLPGCGKFLQFKTKGKISYLCTPVYMHANRSSQKCVEKWLHNTNHQLEWKIREVFCIIWFDTEIVQMIKVSVKNVLIINEENFFFPPVRHDKNLPLIQKHRVFPLSTKCSTKCIFHSKQPPMVRQKNKAPMMTRSKGLRSLVPSVHAECLLSINKSQMKSDSCIYTVIKTHEPRRLNEPKQNK